MPLPASLLLALLLYALPLARSTNAAGLKFLSDNALEDGVVVLPSGLQYKVIAPGSGLETPMSNTTCLLHYTGALADGTEFDSSYKRGKVRCAALPRSASAYDGRLKMENVLLPRACSSRPPVLLTRFAARCQAILLSVKKGFTLL